MRCPQEREPQARGASAAAALGLLSSPLEACSRTMDVDGDGRHVPPFLIKTYSVSYIVLASRKTSLAHTFAPRTQMVDDPSTNDIVSWTSNGEAFVVKKEHEFSTKILPNYFRTNSFSSFVRQLNFYGFRKRSTNMSTSSVFRHKNFKRGKKDLLPLIKKKASESSSLKQTVAKLQQEVKSLREQYNTVWAIQHQIFSLLTRFAGGRATYPAAFPPTAGLPYAMPQAMGPAPPPSAQQGLGGGLALNIDNILAQMNSTGMAAGAQSPLPMIGAPPVAGGSMASPGGAAVATTTWQPPTTARIQDITNTEVDADTVAAVGTKRAASDEVDVDSKKRARVDDGDVSGLPNFLISPLPSPKVPDPLSPVAASLSEVKDAGPPSPPRITEFVDRVLASPVPKTPPGNGSSKVSAQQPVARSQ